MKAIREEDAKLLFTQARTFKKFATDPVSEELLKKAYDLAKMGPTSANCCPMKITFVKSQEAKEKLKACLQEGNIEQTMKAPVTAIICYDLQFYENLPRLWPHADAKSWFVGKEEYTKTTAFRNGTLQGAYFLLAARAVGLDCGPMSGFSNKKVDEAFFANTSIRSNFLINLGFGQKENLHPRDDRLNFEEITRIV